MSPTAFQITKGAVKFYISKSDDGTAVHRAFCPECGSPIYAFNEESKEYIGVMAMSLDDPSWYRPMIDLWTSSAQPWVLFNPDTIKYSQDFTG
jgi:hypothetical protein